MQGDDKNTVKEWSWFKFRRCCRGVLLWVFAFSLLTNLLMLTGPFFMLQIYDRVLSSGSQETLTALLVLVVILYVFYGLLEFSRAGVMGKVAARFQQTMGSRIFEAFLQRAALRKGRESGRTALRDMDTLCHFFSSPVVLALFDIPWTPIFLTVIFLFHPWLGWLAVSGSLVLIFTAFLNQYFTQRLSDNARRQAERAHSLAQQAERSGDYVWAQGLVKTITQRWTDWRNRAMNHQTQASDRRSGFTSFSKAFRLFLQSAMLALGAFLILDAQLTAGAMIAASILLGRALAPVEQTIGSWTIVQQARLSYQTLQDFLDDLSPLPLLTPLPDPSIHDKVPLLEVLGLSVVAATSQRVILNNVSFSLFSGQVLGIIGASGAGKTVLVKTVMGVISSAAGEARLGGATLEQYGIERLGRLIGYLPQDIRFFDGSVAENIAHMDTTPDLESVFMAALKAGVHDVILQLPHGYDTLIGSNFLPLSGGQQQRLALARALFYDPMLLVFDEPNSHLDSQGKTVLRQVIQKMKEQKKAIMITTHQNSSLLTTCDNALILEGGKVIKYLRKKEQESTDGRIAFVVDTAQDLSRERSI